MIMQRAAPPACPAVASCAPSTTAGARRALLFLMDLHRLAPLAGLLDTGTLNNLFTGVKVDDKQPIYNIVKEFPDMYIVQVLSKPKFRLPPALSGRRKNKTIDDIEQDIARSVRRSRRIINDYVLMNDFDLFITFTFNPKKVDRYDLDLCFLRMQSWLWRQQRAHDKSFRYIIVPEKHKDGAIHFHALFGGYKGKLKKTKVIQNNKRVYNLSSFRYGFTNVQYLDDDKLKTVAYLCKYITKDMALVSNRRRYWCSKGLLKPVKYYNGVDELDIKLDVANLEYQNKYLSLYQIPKVAKLFD